MEYGVVVVWWAAAVALAVAGLPIAAALFERLPDRGAALSFPLGIVVLTIPVYWLGHLSFGPLTVAAGVVFLVALSAVLVLRGPPPDLGRFGEAVVVFSLAFLFLVALRAVDPSIRPAGGEKFLDYGLLTSMLRSSVLPPEDFWFAGEPLQYYYGGHLMAAAVTTITGIAERYAYNLAVAWFYGMLVAGAYGLAGSMAETRGRSYRLAGVVGAFFVGFASNLVTPLQAILAGIPSGLARGIAGFVAERTALAADYLLILRPGYDGLFYWHATRVVRGTINEFPLFAFVNADLHAHMMSQPLLLLAMGLAFAYYRTPAEETRRRRVIVYGAIPPLAGLIGTTNGWSFPTPAGLAMLAVLFAPTNPGDLLPRTLSARFPEGSPATNEVSRIGRALAVAAGVVVLGVIWGLPFFAGPATGGASRSLGVVVDRSGVLELLLVHGWVLLVFGVYLGVRAVDRLETDPSRLALLAAIAVVLALLADAAVLVVVAPLGALAWFLLRREDGDLGFETVLFVGGAGIVVLVEFVYLMENPGASRYNTVFKSYSQVWLLWATAAAVPFVGFLQSRSDSTRGRHRQFAAGFVVLLIASLSLYGVVVVGGQVADAGEPTLDATTWAASAHPEEWDAIQWLDTEVEGKPNIVSAPGCGCNPVATTRQYSWVNAPSTFTGVPTVVGWGYGSHQSKNRGADVYLDRVEDVETIYTGSWEQRRELLERYDVEYVWVGPNERALYDDPGFDDREAFEVVFRNSRVTVYSVDGSRL